MTSHADVPVPTEFEWAVSKLPPELRSLVLAELAAGNTITRAEHTHPAPPAGAYVMLAGPVTTRVRESAGGVKFFERNGSHHSGEFADGDRMFFVLESPHPDDSYPDMNAIRARLEMQSAEAVDRETSSDERDAIRRFDESREMNYDRWREGTGYDLDALLSLSARTRDDIEMSLIPAKDWRDVEALVALGSARGEGALREALSSTDVRLRMAVLRRAPHLATDAIRLESVLMALETAAPMAGLSETLDAVEQFHPAPVIEALFRGLLHRPGDIAYHFATVLAVVHGKLSSRFDWSLRPQLLAFNTTDASERRAAFLMLYDLLKKSRKFTCPAADDIAARLRHIPT